MSVLTAASGSLVSAAGEMAWQPPPRLPLHLVLRVPQAAAQPSSSAGREIHRLTVHAGRLYVGYGSYSDNTGPIHPVSLSLTDLTLDAGPALTTEALWRLVASMDGSKLYAPFIDPQGSVETPENGQYAVLDGDTWTTVTTVPGVEHAFDMVETADGLFLFGSGPVDGADCAVIWRSTDDGSTWVRSLAVPRASGFARFYGAAVVDGSIVTALDDVGGVGGDIVGYVWPAGGSAWEATGARSQHLSGAVAFTHGGVPFALTLATGKQVDHALPSAWSVLTLSPGAEAAIGAALPPASMVDAVAAGDWLYFVAGAQVLGRLGATGEWQRLGQLPVDVSCLAVDDVNGWIYFGTSDSRILRTPLPS